MRRDRGVVGNEQSFEGSELELIGRTLANICKAIAEILDRISHVEKCLAVNHMLLPELRDQSGLNNALWEEEAFDGRE